MPDLTIDQLSGLLPEGVALVGDARDGGQGTVFRANYHGSDAAIKVFRADAEARRVDREIASLAAIECPNVVRLLDHFSADLAGEQFRILVYEFHPGGDLMRLLDGAAPEVPAEVLLNVGAQVSTALDALWAKRIVHRDIKPANIVAGADGRFVVVDLGFARHLDESDITMPGGSPGTRGFSLSRAGVWAQKFDHPF